jgi:hypothetical protein
LGVLTRTEYESVFEVGLIQSLKDMYEDFQTCLDYEGIDYVDDNEEMYALKTGFKRTVVNTYVDFRINLKVLEVKEETILKLKSISAPKIPYLNV